MSKELVVGEGQGIKLMTDKFSVYQKMTFDIK